MKKNDIIKALSASVTEYDVESLVNYSNYVLDCVSDNGFYVSKSTKGLIVESLATLSIISKALAEKLDISEEVEKKEESLICDIIATIATSNSREIEENEVDDNHLDDDFDFDSDEEDSDFNTGAKYDLLDDLLNNRNSPFSEIDDDEITNEFTFEGEEDEEESDDTADEEETPFSKIELDDDIADEYIFEVEEDEESDDSVEFDTDKRITDDEFLRAYKKFREGDKKG